jgi:hypothetical protein
MRAPVKRSTLSVEIRTWQTNNGSCVFVPAVRTDALSPAKWPKPCRGSPSRVIPCRSHRASVTRVGRSRDNGVALIPQHTHALQPANKGSLSTTSLEINTPPPPSRYRLSKGALLYLGQQLTSLADNNAQALRSWVVLANIDRAEFAHEPTYESRNRLLSLRCRYSVGLRPHIFRNIRAKCCCVLKPQARAISITRKSNDESNSFAYCTRCCNTNWCGLSPIDFVKM